MRTSRRSSLAGAGKIPGCPLGETMSIKQRFEREPIYLMDGSAFVYRGFYANQSMQRSDGFPTSALFIVARILMRILREEQPQAFRLRARRARAQLPARAVPAVQGAAQRHPGRPHQADRSHPSAHQGARPAPRSVRQLRGGRLPRLACQALPRGTPGDPRGYRQGPQAVPA